MEELALSAGAFVDANGIEWSRLLEADMLARIALQVVLLCGSAFFSGSEVALFSLSQADLSQIRRQRHPAANSLYMLLEQPRRLIISILSGNELINVAAAANMAAILLHLFDDTTAGLLNIVVMVPLLLLFGEVTPKTIAISDPVRISTEIVAKPMTVWVKLVTPLRWVVRVIADRVTTSIVGAELASSNILEIDEVRTLVNDLQASGELQPQERELVSSLMETSIIEVVAIMSPRTQMSFVSEDASLTQVRDLMITNKQQRIPVFAGHHDHLSGFIHAEDIMTLTVEGSDLNEHKLQDLLHDIVVIPPTKRLDETLEYFLNHQCLAAIVLNEFGGVEGMITIRNLVDFVFAPLYGTPDQERRYSEPLPGVFDIPGDMKLTEFNNLTNFSLADPRMTTVGGVVFRHLDQLPKAGDEVIVDGIHLKVLAMNEHRISQLRASHGTLPKSDHMNRRSDT